MSMERERLLTNQLVLCSVRLAILLLLSCSIVINAQTTTVSPPPRQEKSWIVGRRGGTTSESVVPGCTDLCLNALSPIYDETLVGLSVQMYPCQDSDNSLFQYNDSSQAITMWDPMFGVNRCLDAGQFPSTTGNSRFTLQKCNANATTQQWVFQADGQIRSSLVNSSSTSVNTQPLFLQGNSRQAEDWAKGWNTFGLYLSSGANSVDTISSFNLLPYASAPAKVVSPPSKENAGLIINGDFETCGYNLGQSNRVDLSSSTWWFIICSWTITSGSVQLVRSGQRNQNDKTIGYSSLHLNGNNGPGAITQLVATETGSNYSLVFDIAPGDVTHKCGSQTKTLNVSISPSSLPLTSLLLNVSGESSSAVVGWTSPPLLNFTAYGTSTNFTFQSTTDGICGPLIDNVVVRKLQNTSPSLAGKKAANDSALSKVLKVTVSVLAVGLLIFTLLCCCWSWRRWHRSKTEMHFVKRIRCQSEMGIVDSGLNSRSESFSVMYGNQYSWEELETATSNFAKLLDNGGSSLLYLAEFPDGLLAVVKVDTHRTQWTSDDAFKQEVAILHRLHHSYLVSFIGVCVGEGCRRALVFEYMPNGNLFDRLHRLQDNEPMSWQTRMVIAYQVACALEYLHEEASPPIVHRDVQACNVLLQRDDSAKLATFDVAKTGRSCTPSSFDSTTDHSLKKGTYGHLDPAYYRTGRISKKSNVYSYGVLLLELISGLRGAEFDLKSYGTAEFLTSPEEMVNIVDPKLMGKFNKHELSEITDIVVKCLKPEGKSRPSMSDVVFMLRAGFSSSRPLLGG